MAPILPTHDHLISVSTPLQLEDGRTSEKILIETVGQQRQSISPKRKTSKMPGTRALFVALLIGCLVVVGLAHTESDATNNACSDGHSDGCVDTTTSHDKSAFSRWIDATSPEALHKFLHTVTGFQHGVFDSDQAAVQAVLDIDPALSSTVAQLQRRQSNSTTTSSAPAPAQSTTTTSLTTDPVSTPVETSTTATTDTTESTADATTTTSATVVTPTTTTDPATTSATTTADTTTTTTNAPPNTEPTPTTGPASTTTTSKGTTPTAKPTSKTSTHTFTLPGGAVTTITSITVITPGVSDSPTAAATGDPSLQTGAAVPVGGNRKPLVEVLVGGAVAMAMLV